MTEPKPREPGDLLSATALIGFYTALGYVICGIVRSLRGDPGIAVSPLLGFAAFALLAVAVFRMGDRLKARDDWDERKGIWFNVASAFLALAVVAPALLGVLWPLAAFQGLSPAASGWLSVVPLATLIYIAALNRKRRSAGGQSTPD